jgi:hypothetical protein
VAFAAVQGKAREAEPPTHVLQKLAELQAGTTAGTVEAPAPAVEPSTAAAVEAPAKRKGR